MEALKCDRCGRYYDRYGTEKQPEKLITETSRFTTRPIYYKTYDLCPSCMKDVQEWLNSGKICTNIDEYPADNDCEDGGTNNEHQV